MADIYTHRTWKILGGGSGNDTFYTATASAAGFATTSITGDVHVTLRAADWDGATILLQKQDPAGTWVSVSGASWTADVQTNYNFPQFARNIFRLQTKVVSASTEVYCWIQGAKNN